MLVVAGASSSRADSLWSLGHGSSSSLEGSGSFLALSQPFQNNPTVYGSNPFVVGSSGIVSKKAKNKQRKCPTKNVRKPKPLDPNLQELRVDVSMGAEKGLKDKRKAVDKGTSTVKSTKLNPQEVNPKRGFPNAQ